MSCTPPISSTPCPLTMNSSKLILLSVSLLFAGSARAQLNIPLADIDLAYPSIPGVTIQLGATTRTGLPTPFAIDNLVSDSLLWFCMDPLQTIYYSGSGKPVGSNLNYASSNPLNFDKWTPLAPGLSNARIQNLADLFRAFPPTTTNQLISGAMQIAIWEIVNEFDGNPFNLTNGQMRVSGNAALVSTAQGILDSLDDVGVMNFGNSSYLDYLIDGTYRSSPTAIAVLVQDLVGYVPPEFSTTPVPESGTFALGAVGLLLPMIWLKLRRSRSGSLKV